MSSHDSEVREVGLWTRLWGASQRPDKDPNVQTLRSVELFAKLSTRELRRLCAIVHERSYDKGEFMFEQGQPGAAMFIVKQGSLSIVVDGEGDRELEVATLGAGSFVGELALLDDSPRSASARAVSPVQALAFFRADLNKLLDTAPRLSSKIYHALAMLIGKRLKQTTAQLSLQERPGDLRGEFEVPT